MSIYYSPELVKLLMEEHVKEARDANRGSRRQPSSSSNLRSRSAKLARRLVGVQTNPAACACS